MRSLRFLRCVLTVATGAILTSCATVKVQQRPIATAVTPSAYDRQQAEHARNVMGHAMPANTPAARAAQGTKRFGTHSNGAGPPPARRAPAVAVGTGHPLPGEMFNSTGNTLCSLPRST